MTLDSGPRGREFDSRPVRYQVTTLRACVGARIVQWLVPTRNLLGYGSSLTAGHLQATLSKLLTYCLLTLTLSRMGNE